MDGKKVNELIPDSRFKAMGREAIIVTVYWLVMFVGIMLSAVILGAGDPTQYTYLLGFPLWFTVSMGIMIVGIIVGIVLVLKVFRDVSLDAADSEFDYEKGESRK